VKEQIPRPLGLVAGAEALIRILDLAQKDANWMDHAGAGEMQDREDMLQALDEVLADDFDDHNFAAGITGPSTMPAAVAVATASQQPPSTAIVATNTPVLDRTDQPTLVPTLVLDPARAQLEQEKRLKEKFNIRLRPDTMRIAGECFFAMAGQYLGGRHTATTERAALIQYLAAEATQGQQMTMMTYAPIREAGHDWDNYLYRLSLATTYVDHPIIEAYLQMRGLRMRVYTEQGTFYVGNDDALHTMPAFFANEHYRGVEELFRNPTDPVAPAATRPVPTVTDQELSSRNFGQTLARVIGKQKRDDRAYTESTPAGASKKLAKRQRLLAEKLDEIYKDIVARLLNGEDVQPLPVDGRLRGNLIKAAREKSAQFDSCLEKAKQYVQKLQDSGVIARRESSVLPKERPLPLSLRLSSEPAPAAAPTSLPAPVPRPRSPKPSATPSIRDEPDTRFGNPRIQDVAAPVAKNRTENEPSSPVGSSVSRIPMIINKLPSPQRQALLAGVEIPSSAPQTAIVPVTSVERQETGNGGDHPRSDFDAPLVQPEADEEENDSEEEQLCRICENSGPRTRKIIDWIQCDQCEGWLHGHCIAQYGDPDPKQCTDANEMYICPKCRQENRLRSKKSRKYPSDF
jgi:hypothetical protein